MAKNVSLTLKEFGGLHIPEAGEMPLGKNESPNMKNFCITPSGQLKLREGYRVLHEKNGAVRLLWQGTLKKQSFHLALIGTELYRSADCFQTLENIGTLEGEDEVFALEFREKLYLFNGTNIHVCDGEKIEILKPYRPLIRISSPPAGGGIPFEDVNFLTAEVRQTFSADGDSLDFYLAEKRVESVDYVLRDGVKLKPEEDYTTDPFWGYVTIFGDKDENAVKKGVNNIEIGYTLWNYYPETVERCRYGVVFDSHVFLYGNSFNPAMRYYTGLVDGMPSMEYFPASHYSMVGGGEQITSIVRHYDRQIIFTAHEAFYSYPETRVDETGKEYTSFPIYTLSAMHGNCVKGLSLLLANKPLSVMPSGLYLWNNTSVRDERNASCFSARISKALKSENLGDARLFLRHTTGELFLVLSRGIYVYNYKTDLFYYYEGYLPTCMLEDDEKNFFFGTEDGKLCLIGGDMDAGVDIEAHWESPALTFGDETHTKNLSDLTLLFYSRDGAALDVSWHTDMAMSQTRRLYILPTPLVTHGLLCTMRYKLRLYAKRFRHFSLTISHPKGSGDLCLSALILRGRINDQHS
ncbi:MAG: hypothetical protein IKT43_00100 [Clostridia bacterium]|nr:hypothetical protein [Clostridia bacterium]